MTVYVRLLDLIYKGRSSHQLIKNKMNTYKIKKYTITVLIHLLILSCAGLAIYAKSVKYTSEMEKKVLEQQIHLNQ